MPETNLEIAKRFMEHGPKDIGPSNPDLVGWTGKGVDICSECAGRILGRGCDLSRVASVPVWKPSTIKCELCKGGE